MYRHVLSSASVLALLLVACSNELDGADRGPSGPGTDVATDTGSDTDTDTDSDDLCDDLPGAGSVATDPDCTFAPEASGGPLQFRVEWSMAQAMTDPYSGRAIPAWSYTLEPELTSVMQIPVVAQMTDDNGDGFIDNEDTPDIGVVMGSGLDVPGDTRGVLRVLSGDGSRVHAQVYTQSYTHSNSALGTRTYHPYKHSTVAVANLDGDPGVELVVMVTELGGEATCRPAIYKVEQDGSQVSLVLDKVYEGTATYFCGAHAPAVGDIDNDGNVDIVIGNNVLEGDLSFKWSGPNAASGAGRGWFGRPTVGGQGYWNSGYHSFPYDVDGDGSTMEIVAGRHIYTHTGGTYCELGRYDGGAWVPATDGYPAVADLLRFSGDELGEPEIVITGNNHVSVYHGSPRYDPQGQARCLEIASLPNDPWDDPHLTQGFSHEDCDRGRASFGGQPTIGDMTGDGTQEIGVAGACWYSAFRFDDSGNFRRFAMTPTRDWSSASTGSTIFDFNGDGRSEIVFADERALYVYSVKTDSALQPWERFETILEDTNHKSWTIHEYPLVADVDGDGKAEIIVPNAHIPSWPGYYGIYVLGAADDDWVSSRMVWNQHAYHVTNVGEEGQVGYSSPNYLPHFTGDTNDFRNQAPGEFGAKAAPNLSLRAEPPCQEDCGDIQVVVQVQNEGAFITVGPTIEVSLYGENGSARTLIETQEVGINVPPGFVTPGIVFDVSGWSAYERLVAVVDDPALTPSGWGRAKECDEDNNEIQISLDGLCE
ncbi:MAG: VCBS repeat-containing protein [Deltaproteobacteria bacterium]|nr:MAG: VCBS repeat-containing protein [Deltaproteobacteria bacterium]